MTGEGVAGALGATSQHTDHYDLACFNLRDSCIALKHIRGLSSFIGSMNRVWLAAVSGFLHRHAFGRSCQWQGL